jgi:hypothetical protein
LGQLRLSVKSPPNVAVGSQRTVALAIRRVVASATPATTLRGAVGTLLPGVREPFTRTDRQDPGNFLRTQALPDAVEQWSLTTLKGKLIKIGAKVVRHGRHVAFQMAEAAIARILFAEVLYLIAQLRPAPNFAPACGVRLSSVATEVTSQARLVHDQTDIIHPATAPFGSW